MLSNCLILVWLLFLLLLLKNLYFWNKRNKQSPKIVAVTLSEPLSGQSSNRHREDRYVEIDKLSR
jgi:hypothetical protein